MNENEYKYGYGYNGDDYNGYDDNGGYDDNDYGNDDAQDANEAYGAHDACGNENDAEAFGSDDAYGDYDDYGDEDDGAYGADHAYDDGSAYGDNGVYDDGSAYGIGGAYSRPGMGAASQAYLQSYRKSRDGRNRLTAAALAVCMLVGGIFGFAGSYAYDMVRNNRGEGYGPQVLYQSVVREVAAGIVTGVGADEAMSVEETAAIVKQTVVEIMTESTERDWRFGQYTMQGAGSGVIITQDGYIVTNNHVIEGAGNITVRLPDGKTYTATVIGSDPDTDLAVIKVPASGLTPAVLGNSSTLQVGQTALAVGNPLGELGGTVTGGIISALDREIDIEGQKMSLLQTDAAVNPGNSGGGLFNLYGELIGVVNAKSSGSGIEGLGFAIPINSAKIVIEDLISIGYVRGRVSAGLEVVNITTAREAMRYQVNQTGLYIAGSRDSQLQAGDRIVGLNDVTISDFASFKTALSKYKVGDTVKITVQRGNDKVTADIVLIELKP